MCILVPLFQDTATPEFKSVTAQSQPGSSAVLSGSPAVSAAESATSSTVVPSTPDGVVTAPECGRSQNVAMCQRMKGLAKTSDSKKFIHMDAMAFGMGCCCLQVTNIILTLFQCVLCE